MQKLTKDQGKQVNVGDVLYIEHRTWVTDKNVAIEPVTVTRVTPKFWIKVDTNAGNMTYIPERDGSWYDNYVKRGGSYSDTLFTLDDADEKAKEQYTKLYAQQWQEHLDEKVKGEEKRRAKRVAEAAARNLERKNRENAAIAANASQRFFHIPDSDGLIHITLIDRNDVKHQTVFALVLSENCWEIGGSDEYTGHDVRFTSFRKTSYRQGWESSQSSINGIKANSDNSPNIPKILELLSVWVW